MKKFMCYSISISAIIVAICSIILVCHFVIPSKSHFNVKIEGVRDGVKYEIRGDIPANQVTEYVKTKTSELKVEKKSASQFDARVR